VLAVDAAAITVELTWLIWHRFRDAKVVEATEQVIVIDTLLGLPRFNGAEVIGETDGVVDIRVPELRQQRFYRWRG
jgi:hypothetical protein